MKKSVKKCNFLLFCLIALVKTGCVKPIDNIITVIGTGYVGLVTGAGFASLGNQVICVDINTEKIKMLQKKQIPFFEPGLQELVHTVATTGHLSFTDNVGDAITKANILVIAVGTPSRADGHADLSALFKVLDTIICNMNNYKIIVVKSTVPITTNKKIEQYMLEKGIDHSLFAIVSNPEFLREGSAVYDFLNPDRVVIGTNNQAAAQCIADIYKPLKNGTVPLIITDTTSAELIKYASNAFLATKISFINEIANLCDHVDADIVTVAKGMGLDVRINPYFLNPGPGFGGSCFPKDSLELCATALAYNVPLDIVQGSLVVNNNQQELAVKKVKELMGPDLKGKTVCILGLSFKANTDDIRYSPAIKTIELLQKELVTIQAYDPVASSHMSVLFPDVTYAASIDDAVCNADVIIILTEWDVFKKIDWQKVRSQVRQPYLIDMRNIVDPVICMDTGFVYQGIGRGSYKNNNYVYNARPSCN
ncbi:UDP-glucose/GDP-mannose dehydrogenase family protein [Candidatus Dependentiae bacterium]|nr:MAG: UDP-glucose/GDP-mannose dehydrogenase family protein [Candidatus Dependentiae bacterium]